MSQHHAENPAQRPSLLAGVSWMAIGQFSCQGINFLSNWVLLLFLSRADFGIIALAWAFLQVLTQMVDFGTGLCVIQSKKITQELLDTAFTISLMMAAVGGLVPVAAGFVIAQLTLPDVDSHRTAVVLWMMSPACLSVALVTVPNALLQRQQRLDAYAQIDLAMTATRAVVSITLATAGFGVLSIVYGYHCGSVVQVVMARSKTKVRTRLHLYPLERAQILHTGVRLSGYNLVSAAMARADAFLLTPLIGQTSLGVFTMARQLILQPVDTAGGVARAVLVPRFARLQDRVRRARALYLRGDQLLLSGMVPLLCCAALLIDLPITWLGKEEWSSLGPVASALLLAGLANLLLQNPTAVMLGFGRTGVMFRWGILRGCLSVAGILAGAFFGVFGVALVFGGTMMLGMPWLLRPPARILGMSWWRVLAAVLPPLLPAAGCAGAVFAVRQLGLSLGVHLLLLTLLCAAAGLCAYVGLAMLLRIPAWRILRRYLRRQRARARTRLATTG